MGYSSIYCDIILPKPLLIAVSLFEDITLVLSIAFTYLGLSSPLEEQEYYTMSGLEYFSPFGSPSTCPPSEIKRRLPTVDFASFVKKLQVTAEIEAHCAICLERFTARHQVRELGNCCHAFHKGCIDKWVNKSQDTCPLCRASLLPKGKGDEGLCAMEIAT